ncbi:MAG TPA: GDSL-type esterase/lipase family protein [Stellaceae bacterium]|nr:GDSL-type esterase/lipase family protein [Stellaceae bacterium]
MARRITMLAALLTVVLFGVAPAAAQTPAPPKTNRCAVPPDLIATDPTLPGLAKRFHDRGPVVIVAIGGASTAGVAAGSPANAYPQRLQEALARRHPGVPITVINKGVPRQTTREMIARFSTDVLAAKPNLVIWETGTVDAVRAMEVDEFATALGEGITALRAGGAAVMLVNMQYNPNLASVIDFRPYLDALDRAADLDDVYLFDRYQIMRYWNDNGRFDVVDVPSGKQAALAGEIYRCLGETMAGAIDGAAR